ncbi:nitrogenase component 1 [Gaoshiqia sp. Z1-71]|uniref:nitrogenase component 1 n=1 Tax=Gaoshiqia hydrogeniformans TaxID=3290090 RepID=UPI003BF7836E
MDTPISKDQFMHSNSESPLPGRGLEGGAPGSLGGAVINACKLCAPLGASVAFKGIRGCVPIIHGSQGCATYIRRYLISHYKEPVDIASSNFSEESTIFGGGANCLTAIRNVISQYQPEVIGIATTCLSETIGDNIRMYIQKYIDSEKKTKLPHFIAASTPSYQGSHIDGFHEAVAATVKSLAEGGEKEEHVNIFPGFVSPEDLRQIKSILKDFGISFVLLPDYSETLDNTSWESYQRIPTGGTPLETVRKCGTAKASVEFGTILNKGSLSGRVKSSSPVTTAAEYLQENFQVENHRMLLPLGVTSCDRFFETLVKVSGKEIPLKYTKERGRLIDSYIDGHKYVFGKKAVVYGEEDFVVAMSAFLNEIGMEVALAASGGDSGRLENEIRKHCPENPESIAVQNGFDYEMIREWCIRHKPDLLIGNSKAYYISRELDIPIVRCGFPVHDRIGGQRIKHIGYPGTQELFDRIVNKLIGYNQDHSAVGYKYM